MVRKPKFAYGILLAMMTMGADLQASSSGDARALKDRAREVLRHAMATEKGWVKVHAAEALLPVGDVGLVRGTFCTELTLGDDLPHRIGVWRVLAAASVSAEERAGWIRRIEEVFLQPTSPDRLQSVETLAKLRHVLTGRARDAANAMIRDASEADVVIAWWATALTGDKGAMRGLRDALASRDPVARQRAAYALRWLKVNDEQTLAALAIAANTEPPDTLSFPNLLSSALILRADATCFKAWQTNLERVVETGSAAARYEACQALMLSYEESDIPRLIPLLTDPHGDARIGAAWAIVTILNRNHGR